MLFGILKPNFERCFLGNPSERALADSYKIMGWGIRAFLEGADFKVASLEGLKIPRELGLDVIFCFSSQTN